MWALADLRDHAEREQWRKKFGTEFTGMHEGRPVRYTWHEVTIGHICRGDFFRDGHSECARIVDMRWCWLRGPKEGG